MFSKMHHFSCFSVNVCFREIHKGIHSIPKSAMSLKKGIPGGWGERELHEGDQKIQTSSYKINKY